MGGVGDFWKGVGEATLGGIVSAGKALYDLPRNLVDDVKLQFDLTDLLANDPSALWHAAQEMGQEGAENLGHAAADFWRRVAELDPKAWGQLTGTAGPVVLSGAAGPLAEMGEAAEAAEVARGAGEAAEAAEAGRAAEAGSGAARVEEGAGAAEVDAPASQAPEKGRPNASTEEDSTGAKAVDIERSRENIPWHTGKGVKQLARIEDSDLGREALRFRNKYEISSRRNVAVIEYKAGEKTCIREFVSGDEGHSEMIAIEELPSDAKILRMYSDRTPCTYGKDCWSAMKNDPRFDTMEILEVYRPCGINKAETARLIQEAMERAKSTSGK